jgi:Glycosyltransferase sugar-binding region containing DXD motif
MKKRCIKQVIHCCIYVMWFILIMREDRVYDFNFESSKRSVPHEIFPEIPIPPYLISPPQTSNGNKSIKYQCLQHCLSACEASPNNEDFRYANQSNQNVPRILHFVFVKKLDEAEINFRFSDYLVVRASYFRLQPSSIYLHLNAEPFDSPIWRMMKPMVVYINYFDSINEIFGNPVTGQAHVSDIVRVSALLKYGGIYMDIDSISLRPFTNKMWDPPSGLAMGYENQEFNHIEVGVIIARKGCTFLSRWLDTYVSFNDSMWADHTVLMVGKLALNYSKEIDVYPENYFYKPTWRYAGLDSLWKNYDMNYTNLDNFSDAYAPHFWGTFARDSGFIERMTPYTIMSENNGLNQLLRPLLPTPFFSFVLNCKIKDLMKTVWSIIVQSFSLWEILITGDSHDNVCLKSIRQHVVVKFPKFKDHIVKMIHEVKSSENCENCVWRIEFKPGHHLKGKHVLRNALLQALLNLTMEIDNETQSHFVYDPTKGIKRVSRHRANVF